MFSTFKMLAGCLIEQNMILFFPRLWKAMPFRPAATISTLLLTINGSLAGIQTVIGHTASGLDADSLALTNVPAPAAPMIIHSADGYAEISIDTAGAPELRQWAEQKLAPALSEWYPKIVAMLPSQGFSAPPKFSVTIQPGNGVAYTTGTRIVANSTWLASELDRQAVGSIIHETVHVVQQYGHGGRDHHPAPGWLTEGIPDYIRFFKFEPQTHGADTVWLRQRRQMALNYDGMYRISANFLNYVVAHYDPENFLIEKVNAACRDGSYTDGLWQELTGKPLAELNEEWKAAVHQPIAPKDAAGHVPPK